MIALSYGQSIVAKMPQKGLPPARRDAIRAEEGGASQDQDKQ
jgi:hypothetical protein